jgi:hypothetical protein
MEWNVQREEMSAADTAELLRGIARQLDAGALDVDGAPIRVTGPMTISIELDASHLAAHMVVNVWCRRPDRGSRLLLEELARPGG